MRKICSLLLAVSLLAVTMTGCGTKAEKGNQSTNKTTSPNTAEETQIPDAEDNTSKKSDEMLTGKHHVEIEVKDYGTISVELDADTAPITVTNFVNLVNKGFYDGLTFHRIISGFMIQGGDPLGTGTGGSDEKIKGEFSANGVENNILHERGTISMARSQEYDSASSQFFIMHQDTSSLDGQYAAFGSVTKGMDIVDKICEDTQVEDTNGTVAAKNQPVISSIKVID